MKKLAIITTHPIQYYAPVFKILNERNQLEIKVFYTLGKLEKPKFDPGFSREISWDVPLLEGYPFEWAENTSSNPGTRHFKGVVTPNLINQITSWQADAILVLGWAYQGHLKAIRYFSKKIPVYFRGDSTLLNSRAGIKEILRTIFLKWVYSHIRHAFYVGQNNKAYFLKYGLTDPQLSFTPHAIDNSRFMKERFSDVSKLRASLNIKSGDIFILFAGKFEPVKNLDILITAFGNLNVKNVHLVLVGNGIDEAKLKVQAKTVNHTEQIHFMDFQNQSYMPVLYQACDLFCLPSKSETWGLCINEAMACGKAILVSDRVGCAPDLVQSGKNGLVFKHGSSEELTKALTYLIKDKATLGKLGLHSLELIHHWTFEHIAKAIESNLRK